jgi:16S rRNA (guanine(966)-N(2))-methyltransferase RsmD
MRVIAGKFKGRKLVGFNDRGIRPTTDRVKESVFNILGGDLGGLSVLDLFSGTGSLAVEALSRGASRVVSVEKSRGSLQVMKKNKDLVGIGAEWSHIQSDVFAFLAKSKEGPFDVILIDPPFTEKFSSLVMESVAKSRLWGEETVIVIESSRQEEIRDEYEDLICVDRRTFGDKLASFYRRRE